jgi:hypothetical protein
VLNKVGAVAYRIKLPKEMSNIHSVFHILQLRKFLRVPETEHIPVEAINLQGYLKLNTYR